jgi:Cdc6-like AAA superfamily ATPase
VEGIETRTIGREAELTKMQSTFAAVVREKQTNLISIVAEAGTGKSRLLYEFGNWLETQAHSVRLFKGRASLEMVKLPYALIRDLLSTSLKIHDSDNTATARQKLEQGISEYTGNQDAVMYAHFIGHLIGFDFPDLALEYSWRCARFKILRFIT